MMINSFKQLLIFMGSIIILIASCKKDDLTPYDNAQGIWFFTSVCEGSTADEFQDILPNSINVEGEGEGQLSVTFLDSISVTASIDDNGNVIISEQALSSFDYEVIEGFPIEIELEVSGNGVIDSYDSGILNLEYSIGLLGSFTCVADLFREEPIDEDEGEEGK